MGWFNAFFAGAAAPGKESDPDYSAAIAKAEKLLSGMPEEQARFLACIAFLMAKVANADSQITQDERDKMEEVLVTEMKLTHAFAKVTASIALESEVSGTIDLHIVIRRLNELATHPQKLSIIRALFMVAAVQDISSEENTVIDQLASGLLIGKQEFFALRSEFRDRLALLKNLPGAR